MSHVSSPYISTSGDDSEQMLDDDASSTRSSHLRAVPVMRFKEGGLPTPDTRRMSEDVDDLRSPTMDGELSDEIKKMRGDYGLDTSSDEDDEGSDATSPGSALSPGQRKKKSGKKTGLKKKKVSKVSLEAGEVEPGTASAPERRKTSGTSKKGTIKKSKPTDGAALPPPLIDSTGSSPALLSRVHGGVSVDDFAASDDSVKKRRSLQRVKSLGSKNSSGVIKRASSQAPLPPPPSLALPPSSSLPALTEAPPPLFIPPPSPTGIPPPLDTSILPPPLVSPPPTTALPAPPPTASPPPPPPIKRPHSSETLATARPARPTEGPVGNPKNFKRLLDGAIRLTKEMFKDPASVHPAIFAFDAPETDLNVVYLDDEDHEDFSHEFPSIKAATLEKIVVGLTPETHYDPDFSFAFLLNFGLVTTYQEIIDLLAVRWNTPTPDSGVDPDTFANKKLRPVRLRVFNLLKTWLEEHYRNFENNANLCKSVEAFINDVVAKDMGPAASTLIKLLSGLSERYKAFSALQFDQKPPRPILPTNVRGKLSILDLHPEELARQITIVDHSLLRAIKPGEFLGLGWAKSDKEQRSPGILAMIANFNRVSHWAASEILSQPDTKARAQVLVRFIIIAHFCLQLNNFNGVMQMLAALQNSSIHRLYKTWELLPQRAFDMFESMSLLMNGTAGEGNFKAYRDALKKAVPPCVPYLGVYLTDLTFLNDGNPDFLDSGKTLINIVKMVKIARVVRNVIMFQQTPYCLAAVDFMKEFITSSAIMSEQEQYNKSIELEPKMSRQEKLTLTKEKKKVKPIDVDFKALNVDDSKK